jgi:hypothetical protein
MKVHPGRTGVCRSRDLVWIQTVALAAFSLPPVRSSQSKYLWNAMKAEDNESKMAR